MVPTIKCTPAWTKQRPKGPILDKETQSLRADGTSSRMEEEEEKVAGGGAPPTTWLVTAQQRVKTLYSQRQKNSLDLRPSNDSFSYTAA